MAFSKEYGAMRVHRLLPASLGTLLALAACAAPHHPAAEGAFVVNDRPPDRVREAVRQVAQDLIFPVTSDTDVHFTGPLRTAPGQTLTLLVRPLKEDETYIQVKLSPGPATPEEIGRSVLREAGIISAR